MIHFIFILLDTSWLIFRGFLGSIGFAEAVKIHTFDVKSVSILVLRATDNLVRKRTEAYLTIFEYFDSEH